MGEVEGREGEGPMLGSERLEERRKGGEERRERGQSGVWRKKSMGGWGGEQIIGLRGEEREKENGGLTL